MTSHMLSASRRLIFNVIYFLIISLVLLGSVFASEKKGISLASLNSPDRIVRLNAAWYYTWKPYPIIGAPEEKFVPMVSGGPGGKRFKKDLSFLQSQPKSKYLLTINEPNKKKHGNKTPEEVVKLWPQFVELADEIGSPAPAGLFRPWWDKFYHLAKKKHLKVDFMAVHKYGPPDAESFLKQIDEVYDRYRMPIWITEFAVADWESAGKYWTNRYSEKQVLDFMKKVLPELEKRPYVVRYAWFGAGSHSLKHEAVRTSRLFEADGTLTELGRYYADFTWPSVEKEAH